MTHQVENYPQLGASALVREVEAAKFISRKVVRNMTCCKNHCTYICDLLVSLQIMDDSGKRGKWWFGRGRPPQIGIFQEIGLGFGEIL